MNFEPACTGSRNDCDRWAAVGLLRRLNVLFVDGFIAANTLSQRKLAFNAAPSCGAKLSPTLSPDVNQFQDGLRQGFRVLRRNTKACIANQVGTGANIGGYAGHAASHALADGVAKAFRP